MTADMHVQFQVCVCDVEIEATTWSLPDTDGIVNQHETDIVGISSKDQMQFMKECTIRGVMFRAWWLALGVQEHQKTIQQWVIYIRYQNMNLVSHILL
jgi:hypothetical protein